MVYVHPHTRKGRAVKGHYRRRPQRRDSMSFGDIAGWLIVLLILGVATSGLR